MKWGHIQEGWWQLKSGFKRRWSRLSNVDVISGNRARLSRNIQARYGITADEAGKQLDDWQRRQQASKPSA